MLISRQLAEAQGLQAGDTLRLSRQRDGRDPQLFVVAGIYEPVPDPMKINRPRHELRMHLSDLEIWSAREGEELALERINIALHDPSRAADVAAELERTLPGVAAQPVGGRPATPFVVLERFHQAIALVTLLGGSAFLLALMVMRTEERRETAGILRLLGCARHRILWEVLLEGLLVAIPGAVLGVLLAVGIEDLFNAVFQWHYDTSLVFIRVTPAIMARCVALSVPLGVAAGLVASWSLLRRGILELIRR